MRRQDIVNAIIEANRMLHDIKECLDDLVDEVEELKDVINSSGGPPGGPPGGGGNPHVN